MQLGPRTRAAVGPLLILGTLLVLLRNVVLFGHLPGSNLDATAFFLPTHCFLGTALGTGEIPAWNPLTMSGAPFAADPQSGWMWLPAMTFFTALPCEFAFRLLLVMHPILTGLGLFWFLRLQGLSRTASTIGGLVLAVRFTGPLVQSIPFAGTVAWTTLGMALAVKYARAGGRRERLLWLLALAVAWGQLASAHMSHGLFIGTTLILVVTWIEGHRSRGGVRGAASAVGLLLLALPFVNLAILVPRLAYLPRTTLAGGYEQLASVTVTDLTERAANARWIRGFVVPGRHALGAIVVLMLGGAFAVRRLRTILLTFAAIGVVAYLLTLRVVAERLEAVLVDVPLGDVYLHAPGRFRYLLLIAVAVVAAIAVEGFLRSPRWLLVLPGAIIVALGEVLASSSSQRLMLTIGTTAGIALIAVARRRPALGVVVPLVVAVELVLSARLDRARPGRPIDVGALMTEPAVLASAPATGSRLVSLDEDEVRQRALANLHGMVFRHEEAQGYNPVQPERYARYLRAVNEAASLHNSALLLGVEPSTANVLGIDRLLARKGTDPGGDWSPAQEGGGRTLFVRPTPARASVVSTWEVVPNESFVLVRVTDPGFDPDRTILLEEAPPGAPRRASRGTARFRWTGLGTAEVDVRSNGGVVLIRNSYDERWRAEIAGRDVPVLRADFILQAVVVPAGHHVVSLRYSDPLIGYGAMGTLASIALLLVLAARSPRRGGSSVEEDPEPGPPRPD